MELHPAVRFLARVADLGRGGDAVLAHLRKNDVVVPAELQTPQIRAQLARILGRQLARFTVGTKANSFNPKTHLLEFQDTRASNLGLAALLSGASAGSGTDSPSSFRGAPSVSQAAGGTQPSGDAAAAAPGSGAAAAPGGAVSPAGVGNYGISRGAQALASLAGAFVGAPPGVVSGITTGVSQALSNSDLAAEGAPTLGVSDFVSGLAHAMSGGLLGTSISDAADMANNASPAALGIGIPTGSVDTPTAPAPAAPSPDADTSAFTGGGISGSGDGVTGGGAAAGGGTSGTAGGEHDSDRPGGDGMGGYARGGRVTGPGGPRDDAVTTRTSAGEFVLNAAAADAIEVVLGKGALERLNAIGNLNEADRAKAHDEAKALLGMMHRRRRAIAQLVPVDHDPFAAAA